MADNNGELKDLKKRYSIFSSEHNIKRQEILDVLDEFLKGLKKKTGIFCAALLVYGMILKKISKRHSAWKARWTSLFRSRKIMEKARVGDLYEEQL